MPIKNKKILVRLSEAQADAFEERCLANSTPMSKVLRTAIAQYLCNTKANDTHQPNLANGGWCNNNLGDESILLERVGQWSALFFWCTQELFGGLWATPCNTTLSKRPCRVFCRVFCRVYNSQYIPTIWLSIAHKNQPQDAYIPIV